jgi:hypothetical protein
MKYWVRGISRITAAVTGLLLIYGITFALEGMTTRIPATSQHELLFATFWMLPWMLLFCSGMEDFETATHQASFSWVGPIVALVLLYYLEHHTSDRVLTKAAMPFLATAGGLLPHIIRRMNFVFTIFSLAAGIAGCAAIVFYLTKFLSGSMGSFATGTMGFLFYAFVTTSVATAILSIPSFRPRTTEMT